MADFGSLKKSKTGIAAPPPPEAAGDNTKAPETAPAGPTFPTPPKPPPRPPVPPAPPAQKLRDGRSLRKTGRTHQFATRIKEETHGKMYDLAARDQITLGELIERAVDAYDRATK